MSAGAARAPGTRGGVRRFLADDTAELAMDHVLILCAFVVPLVPVIDAGQAVLAAYLDLVGFSLALPFP